MNTHRYNPMSEIDIKSDHARSMLSAISDGCVLDEGDKARHFVEMAKLLQEGMMAQTLSTQPEENQNLPFIFDLLQGKNGDGFADPEKFEELLIDMRMNPVAGGIAQPAAAALDAMGERERGSVLSTLQRSLKWASDPPMRRQLSASDFRFAELGTRAGEGTTIDIVLPTRLMDEYNRWMRVLTTVSIRAIEALPEPPKIPVLFILDEYPKMGGSLKAIDDGVATLRSANVKLWIFVQNVNQLVTTHTRNWQTFVSASTVQVFGVSDENTASWVSRMLGDRMHTERKGKWWHPWFLKKIVHQAPKPLYTPAEVMKELGKTAPRQVVFSSETPNKTYELTPGGTLEQTVHTQLDDAARMADSGKSNDQGDAAKAFKKHLLLRREFTRVRGHEHDEGR